jgi:glucose/arabinose dehydrogenase
MKLVRLLVFLALLPNLPAAAEALPGFKPELLGSVPGFATSIVADSTGTLYYTTSSGGIFRLTNGQSARVATLPTHAAGDSGLLGMALIDDRTAVVHYTTPEITYDVISKVDLVTGSETVLERYACDIEVPSRPASAEHHGGNPIVAPDGSIFIPIGEYGGGAIAAKPEWNGGKIHRILPDGTATKFARGLRNPFDVAWDAARQRLIVADNGPINGDELNIVAEGDYCGWPFTVGDDPPVDGALAPAYVFPDVVAPTGIVLLNGANPTLRSGLLLGAFIAKAIFYFPDINRTPIPDPIALIQRETGFVIDVTQTASGAIYFTTGTAIYALRVPAPGDCNGDGLVNASDFRALASEASEGPHVTTTAQNGAYRGSWGCDANADGVIDSADAVSLAQLTSPRPRPARH